MKERISNPSSSIQRVRTIAQGENKEMLRLKRQLHETLPIGPEVLRSEAFAKRVEATSLLMKL
jgi:hypothetical protein